MAKARATSRTCFAPTAAQRANHAVITHVGSVPISCRTWTCLDGPIQRQLDDNTEDVQVTLSQYTVRCLYYEEPFVFLSVLTLPSLSVLTLTACDLFKAAPVFRFRGMPSPQKIYTFRDTPNIVDSCTNMIWLFYLVELRP